MFSGEGYRALTTASGYVTRSDRGVLRVTGADRTSWLQGLLTNDVEALRPGQTVYAAYLTPQGRMIADMRVAALPDATLLDVPQPLVPALCQRMDGLIFAESVQLADVSGSMMVVEIHGPDSVDVVRRAEPPGSAIVIRDDQFGIPGWVLFVPRDAASSLRGELARLGVPETSLDTLEVIRIEAGIPRFLADMTEDTIPLEAGIEDRAISFTKGCYVGQEIIVRVVHRGGGRVARRLVGLSFAGVDAGSPGDRLVSGEREVGQVTSAAWSPAVDHAIALGYVHRDFTEPGTPLLVAAGDRRMPVAVASLPFVKRSG